MVAQVQQVPQAHKVTQELQEQLESEMKRAAAAQDYDAFYAKEREFRERMQYPPSVAMVSLVVKGRTADAAMREAGWIATRLRARFPNGKVLGPAPAPLSRLRDEHRVQVFVKSRQRNAMRLAIQSVLTERPELRRKVIIDVDPINVL